MAHKAVREADGKRLIARWLGEYSAGKIRMADKVIAVGPDTNLAGLVSEHTWLASTRLVVKPDQLVKRRGKHNLVLLDAAWSDVQAWLQQRRNQPVTIGEVTGVLDHFIVEAYVPHRPEEEYYVAITSARDGDTIMFHPQGGVDVGDIDAKAARLVVPVGQTVTAADIEARLLGGAPESARARIAGFLETLFRVYVDLNFAYMEMNPVVVTGEIIAPLDLAAKLDDTAEYLCAEAWEHIEFPKVFGRTSTPEEKYVADLDATTGASLKLMILNPEGRVWSMVAGGGASVIYADTITDLGFMDEMANYGEYSGDPNAELTYLYAKTILDLMTRTRHPKGKVLLIGGGIANFTDVASTFTGIVRALREYKDKLLATGVRIYVRRGGPNYQEGLRIMRELGAELGLPLQVYGPETHMTEIVSMALKEES